MSAFDATCNVNYVAMTEASPRFAAVASAAPAAPQAANLPAAAAPPQAVDKRNRADYNRVLKAATLLSSHNGASTAALDKNMHQSYSEAFYLSVCKIRDKYGEYPTLSEVVATKVKKLMNMVSPTKEKTYTEVAQWSPSAIILKNMVEKELKQFPKMDESIGCSIQ